MPVLVAQVDGTIGQLLLSCLTPTSEEEEVAGGSVEEDGIFWMNNGVKESQRGNQFVVHLEESVGGGNYTCHRAKSGSLLNYTVVLIKEGEATRKKILVKNDHGGLIFVSQLQ